HIDAAATARTGEPHVRAHVPERTLTTWIVLDVSPSMAFGTNARLKADVAEGVALVLGRLAVRRAGAAGLVRFGFGAAAHIQPPRGAKPGVVALRRALAEGVAPDGQAHPDALADALARAVPVAIAALYAARRRARRYEIRFPAVSSMLAALPVVPRWRRVLPTALALAAMAMLAVAAARPQHTVRVALSSASIMLVTDHSGSMQATDVRPTRLKAAQTAANSFIKELPQGVKLGIVAFSLQPDAAQAPTSDYGAIKHVVDSQVANGGTATGDALAVALALLQQQSKQSKPNASAIILLS